MNSNNPAQINKLQWAAKMLSLLAGVTMLLGFFMVSARSGAYSIYPTQWRVLLSVSIIFPIVSIFAWRFQLIGGATVIVISLTMIIYNTLAITSSIWHESEPSFYSSDFWWAYINIALDISVVFMISGILHILSGYLKRKRAKLPM
jgi:hypothetical protein